MPRHKQFKVKKRTTIKVSKKNRGQPRETSPDAESWHGGFAPLTKSVEVDTHMLLYIVALSSTAGGAIANVYGNAPSLATNWAEWNAVYGEYRTLGFQVRYLPSNKYSKTTTVCLPGLVVQDRRNSTALTSLAGAAGHPSSKWITLEDGWTVTMRMSNAEESMFMAVSVPADLLWIKLYFTGLSVSTNYGYIEIRYVVQFRNIE